MYFKKLLTFTLFIFIGFSTWAQKNNSTNNLLWKISGNGLTTSSYLYGTMHVKDARAFHLSDSVYLGIKNCDVFAAEIDMDATFTNLFKLLFKKDSTNSLKEKLSAEEYELLNQKVLEKMNVSLDNLNTNDPWVLELFLNDYEHDDGEDQKQTFLDAYLYSLAKKMGKKTMGLEQLDDYSSIYSRFDEKSQLNRLVNQTKIKSNQSAYDTLIQLYSHGDLNAIENYISSAMKTNTIEWHVMNLRNRNMANRMDSVCKKQSLFTAVGAAHLPGDSGLINLLRLKGYTVTPVKPIYTLKESDLKYDEIEYSWYELKNKNGTFSVNTPTESILVPFEFNTPFHLETYLSMDMYQSAFYMSMMMDIGRTISKESEETVLERASQAMKHDGSFEVISKKYVGNANPSYYEFLMKKEKYLMKFRIFTVNTSLVMLATIGDKKTISSKNAEKYFSSLKTFTLEASPVSPDFKLYTSDEGAFQIFMPESSTDFNQKVNSPDSYKVTVKMRFNKQPISENTFLTAYYLFEEGMVLADPKTYVLSTLENIKLAKNASILEQHEEIIDSLHFCVSFLAKTADVYMKGKYIARGNRPYMLLVNGTSESIQNADVANFFNSFSFINYKKTNTLSYSPADSSFSVKCSLWPKIDTSYTSSINSTSPIPFQQYVNYAYTDINSSCVYAITNYQMPKYFNEENIQELLDRQANYILDSAEIIVSDTFYVKNNCYVKDVVYHSSYLPSHRIMFVLAEDCFYELSVDNYPTYSNLISTQDFFNSFTVKVKDNNWRSKDQLKILLEDLASVDSTTSHSAFIGLNTIRLSTKNYPFIKEALDKQYAHDSFWEYYTVKKKLLQTILSQSTDQQAAIDFFEKYYLECSNNPVKQKDIIESLSFYDSLQWVLFKDLTLKNPIRSDSLVIEPQFTYSNGPSLYPEICSLVKYPAYHDFILFYVAQSVQDVYNYKEEKYESRNIPECIEPYNEDLLAIIERHVCDTSYRKTNWKGKAYAIVELLEKINTEHSIQLLQKLLNHSLIDMKYEACISLTKMGIPIDEKLFKEFAKNYDYCLPLYRILEEHNKVSLFPKEFLSQTHFAIAELYEYASDDWYTFENIEIVASKKMKINKKKGIVYLVKYKASGSDLWYTGGIGLYNVNKNKVESYHEYVSLEGGIFDDKTIDEHFASYKKYMEEASEYDEEY